MGVQILGLRRRPPRQLPSQVVDDKTWFWTGSTLHLRTSVYRYPRASAAMSLSNEALQRSWHRNRAPQYPAFPWMHIFSAGHKTKAIFGQRIHDPFPLTWIEP
jgi:hypothetical protein